MKAHIVSILFFIYFFYSEYFKGEKENIIKDGSGENINDKSRTRIL